MIAILQLIACFGVPVLILRRRDKGLTKLFGTIAMAYVWGILLAVAVWLCNRLGVSIKLSADIGQIGS